MPTEKNAGLIGDFTGKECAPAGDVGKGCAQPGNRDLSRRAFFARFPLRIEPEWAAEALRGALAADPGSAAAYHRDAEALYQLPAGQRDAAFGELDSRRLEQLGLMASLRRAAEPFGALLEKRALYVLRPAPPLEEGADLAHCDARPVVRLALKPERLFDREALPGYCTHEFGHVEDMLDPGFAYDANRPLAGSTRTERELVRERFRVLWGASVDGRLAQRKLPVLLPPERWHLLACRAFPRANGDVLGALIGSLLTGSRPTHAELLERCASSDLGASVGSGPAPGQPCPLCRFMTHTWASAEELAPAAAAIAGEFHGWSLEQGACQQCVTCYQPI